MLWTIMARVGAGAAHHLRAAGVAVAGHVRAAWSHRAVRIACPIAAVALTLWPPLALVHHVYFDRDDLPELAPFILFQPPTTGEVTDARGEVVIQLAREYRRVLTYDDVPLVMRQAILAAEDKNFHSHSGVDYGALPRVIQKAATRSLAAWWSGSGLRLMLPQGGSTITQQLVRVYFLGHLTARRDDDAVFVSGLTVPRVLSAVLGAHATNKLLRKLEEVRLALWLEEAMRQEYGTTERAKREIFARYASFIYLGSGRYGFGAASEYYFNKPLAGYTIEDAGRAALLAGIGKSPRDYAPVAGSSRPRQRRNEILALMARNGYIPEDLARRCRGEPVGAVRPAAQGITVAVRIGFDDNRTLGPKETGGRAALPVFREIMARVYRDALAGTVPRFPREMEGRIDAYLATATGPDAAGPVAEHRSASMDRGRTID